MSSTTDFSTLGRLGTADGASRRRSRGATRGARRRPAVPVLRPGRGPVPVAAVPRLLAVGVIALLLLLWAIGAVVGSQTRVTSAVALASPSVAPELQAALRTGDATAVSTGAVSLVPGGGSGERIVDAPAAFAAVEDVALHLPLQVADDVVFLEADTAVALPLAPVGELTRNDNPDGYREADAFDGPAHVVAPPVSGVRPATGMAALLAAPGTPVTAPVQGVVEAVRQVTTADGAQDWEVVLRPAGRDDLHVVLRHLEAPAVGAGDAVTAGRTQLGVVRAGAVLDGPANPLAMPSVLVTVQPAVEVGLLSPTAPAEGDRT